jgi:16S rRNA (guanine527-N7)-methyltransferase
MAPGGVLVAMKGVHPYEEIARLPAGWTHDVVELDVPGLDAARHLVFLRAAAENAQ